MKTQEVTLSGKSAGLDSTGDMAMQDKPMADTTFIEIVLLTYLLTYLLKVQAMIQVRNRA